ncbi:MAG TPA: hypothetical protein VEG34_04235, partial [Thermoanaerobaculia bacterium]|nr:hypothetical protein [Thermoanaerobaculia bacterium]
MELGATLCSPRAPKCLLCPLLPGCRAGRAGEGEAYPTPRPKRAPQRHRLAVAVVEDEIGGGVLLLRRGDDSPLLAGTWELPWVEVRDVKQGEGGEEPETALAARYGGLWHLAPSQAQVRHGITFRDLTVDVFRAELARESRAALLRAGAGFFDAAGRAALPLSSLVGKVLRVLGIEKKS